MLLKKSSIPYSSDDLLKPGKARRYTGRQLDQIAFPIGGIGTGSIALGGWGQLRDFEIFNRPSKGLLFQMSFFTLHARPEGGEPVTKLLQGPVGGDNFTLHGSGVDRATGAGLPHFRSATFVGEFPFGRLELEDDEMPLEAAVEAFNPFIPLNDKDSSIPVAIFLVHLKNPTKKPKPAPPRGPSVIFALNIGMNPDPIIRAVKSASRAASASSERAAAERRRSGGIG